MLANAGEKISDDEAATLVSSVISGGTDTTTAPRTPELRARRAGAGLHRQLRGQLAAAQLAGQTVGR